MRILACFKIVRDLENVIDSDWKSAKDAGFRINYTKKLINDPDQGALETALRIRDAYPDAELCAVTVSDDDAGSFFTGLFAVGFDSCAQIRPEKDLTYRPFDTAKLLADFAAKTGPYDAILTGAQAPPADSRQVPYILSELLDLACIDCVRTLSYEDGRFLCVRRTQLADETYEADCPCVFVMEDPRYAYLRVPTLRERLKVSGKKAEQITCGMPDGEETAVVSLQPARQERNCRFVKPEETDEILGMLFSQSRGEDAV